MAEIIDLDFYRRFRVALPIRPEALEEGRPHRSARPQSKKFKKWRSNVQRRRNYVEQEQ